MTNFKIKRKCNWQKGDVHSKVMIDVLISWVYETEQYPIPQTHSKLLQ